MPGHHLRAFQHLKRHGLFKDDGKRMPEKQCVLFAMLPSTSPALCGIAPEASLEVTACQTFTHHPTFPRRARLGRSWYLKESQQARPLTKTIGCPRSTCDHAPWRRFNLTRQTEHPGDVGGILLASSWAIKSINPMDRYWRSPIHCPAGRVRPHHRARHSWTSEKPLFRCDRCHAASFDTL